MKYLYYPGCSLEGTAREYDISTRGLLGALGIELLEPADWTCCGATAAEAVSGLLALALPARVLALAERDHPGLPLLAPCSACYLNLKKVEEKSRADRAVLDRINQVLAAEGLELHTPPRVSHLLEVLVTKVPAGRLAEMTRRPLDGLTVAPYYGCQCLRPYKVFDDPEEPRSMEPFLRAVGAGVHGWEMGSRCCGASHMNTKPEVGLELVAAILRAARGADAIVTVCPMCQMNLEGFQGRVSRAAGEDLAVPVLYLPQLLGLALGLPDQEIRLDLNLAVPKNFTGRR
ncbi:MAG: CoB--CoM heterodisulfide reductase iron-sulfur subunit B family protein [Thermodesulfobacteriota bacterium]